MKFAIHVLFGGRKKSLKPFEISDPQSSVKASVGL